MMPYTDKQIVATVNYISLKLNLNVHITKIAKVKDSLEQAIRDVAVNNPPEIIIEKNRAMFSKLMGFLEFNAIYFPPTLEVKLTNAGESFALTSGGHIEIYREVKNKKESKKNKGILNIYDNTLRSAPKKVGFLDLNPDEGPELIFEMDEDIALEAKNSHSSLI